MARFGAARPGVARIRAGLDAARPGVAGLGVAKHGSEHVLARQGMARLGRAWQGEARKQEGVANTTPYFFWEETMAYISKDPIKKKFCVGIPLSVTMEFEKVKHLISPQKVFQEAMKIAIQEKKQELSRIKAAEEIVLQNDFLKNGLKELSEKQIDKDLALKM